MSCCARGNVVIILRKRGDRIGLEYVIVLFSSLFCSCVVYLGGPKVTSEGHVKDLSEDGYERNQGVTWLPRMGWRKMDRMRKMYSQQHCVDIHKIEYIYIW